MRDNVLLIFAFCLATNYYAQAQHVYTKTSNGPYVRIVHNDETNTTDTFIIDLHRNYIFTFSKKGGEATGMRMIGNWKAKGNIITLTNHYPSEKFLTVKVLPYRDSCNGRLPALIINNGKVTRSFFLNANGNTYTPGDIIPYAELDTSGKVQICSSVSNLCSDWFTIPYKDCYRFLIDIDIDPVGYDAGLTKMYFRKQKNKLKLIKSESSRPIPN
jgi:hypothetical protein